MCNLEDAYFALEQLTVLHEVAELLVLDPTIWGAVVVNNPLYLLPGQVGRTTTAHHKTTDELCRQDQVGVQ